jgi:hypothetical protein
MNRNKIYLKGLFNTDPKISFIPQGLLNTFAKKFADGLFTKNIENYENF